jgi:FKBP-type peptidyl-prolyl cis-trans isomerase FkpA
MSRCLGLVLAVTVALATGCSNSSSPSSPTAATPPRAEFSQTDLRVGTGTAASNGRVLTVNYTGWLYDPSRPEQKGTQFDSSVGRSPFSFTLGAGQVIRGWDQGVPGMSVGGLRRLVIPPELGYGSVPNGGIPANSTLVFEVELLSVQ